MCFVNQPSVHLSKRLHTCLYMLYEYTVEIDRPFKDGASCSQSPTAALY